MYDNKSSPLSIEFQILVYLLSKLGMIVLETDISKVYFHFIDKAARQQGILIAKGKTYVHIKSKTFFTYKMFFVSNILHC